MIMLAGVSLTFHPVGLSSPLNCLWVTVFLLSCQIHFCLQLRNSAFYYNFQLHVYKLQPLLQTLVGKIFFLLQYIFKMYFIEVQLIYNVVLTSTIQQNDSVKHIYTFFFIFFSIMFYHRILNIAPCAIEQDLVVYPFYLFFN